MTNSILTAALACALGVSLTLNLVRPASNGPELDLNDAQRDSIATCCEGVCSIGNELTGEVQRLALAIADELARDTPDADLVRRLGDELAEVQAERVKNCVESALLVRDVLSTEQVRALRADCCAGGE